MSIFNPNQVYTEVLDLLHTRALEGWTMPALIEEVVGSLVGRGMQLYRVRIGRPILHPLYAVGTHTWYSDSGVRVDTFSRGFESQDSYRLSPLRPVFESGALEGRYRIRTGSDSDRFPMFVRDAAEGATDYFIQLEGFNDRATSPAAQDGIMLSWTSAAPNGFIDEEIELLQRLRKPLCVEVKSLAQRSLAKDILRAYIGSYSADRVFAGQIQRGDADVIDAVILFCDLRGSSKLAEQYDLDAYLNVLNEYFEITAGTVIEGGGEVLRYIGDAFLAIFPMERYENERDACQDALEIALRSVERLKHFNAQRLDQGETPIKFGIGLHCGTVMYGNIGTPGRIEFTVIGKAANEASRIEAKCKELNETILASGVFADYLDRLWKSHGVFELRNIARPIEIFSPG